jgi:hypothetical protein
VIANRGVPFHIEATASSSLKRELWPMSKVRNLNRNIQLLSELVFVRSVENREPLSALGVADLPELEALAMSNHVILRAFEPLQQIFTTLGNNDGAEWVENAIHREHSRIDHGLSFLDQICATLESSGCPVTVIKSLDHWPDLGSDLDLYTDADAARVVEVMRSRFTAKLADRSWGDRLANKWNFIVPGLPELVEVHAGRLGQTGEQTAVTRSVASRARQAEVGGHMFRVTAPEDRIVISTLQRMYRHFYIRLCDIVDNARLLDSHGVDFAYLRSLGLRTGLWEGIATYLNIISEYVEAYRDDGVPLPAFVTRAAKFGSDQLGFRRNFLRVPILPHSVKLYASELKTLLLQGEVRNSFRLSLLPCLATAAALEQKITGSDKGIW